MTPEQLEEVISLGLRILPTIDKKSVLKDWPNTAPSEPEQIRELFAKHPTAQPAAIVPNDIIILDLDPRNGGSLEALEAVTGPLPDTLTSWSGRGDGGRHLWFKKPAGEISQRQLPKGVDLRKPGVHYVIIPPALHNETGKPYAWNDVPFVAELPQQAVDALAPRKPSVTLPAPVSEHSGNLDGLVRSVAEAVEGERNAKLYWAACRAFDHGDEAVVQDLFEAALSAGLTDSEASATIDSARRTDRQQPEPFVPSVQLGHMRDAAAGVRNRTPEPQPKSDAEIQDGSDDSDGLDGSNMGDVSLQATPAQNSDAESDPLAGSFTAASLMTKEFPPLEYVVPGVIPEGLTMLVAPPKIGKSWLVLGLAKACTEDGYAFGTVAVDSRPVLYLALEDGQRRLQDRLRTLGMEAGNSNLTMMTDLNASALKTIRTFVQRNAEHKPLVILDTLGKAREIYNGNDAYQKDYAEIGYYKDVTDQHPGSSLVIVHHTNKGAHGDFVSSVSGTQGITGAADSILTIERGRAEDDATLNVTSRDAAEGSYAVSLDNGVWTLDGTGLLDAAKNAQTRKATTGLGDAMTEVIELVSKHPEGIKPKDVATLLHWEDHKARTYLRRAYESGRIQRLERGLYTPVSSVSSVSFPSGTEPIDTQDTQDTPPTGEVV